MTDGTDQVDELMELLRSRGQRATVARRAVLAELVDAGETHLGAEELARRIQRHQPAIHLSTVYRTLETLSQAELISVARFGDQPITYHLVSDVHHHAVCSRCQTAHRLPPSVLEPVRQHLATAYGFEADPHHVTITGLCEACRTRPG